MNRLQRNTLAVAIVIVNIFVIPAFAKVFSGFGAELPLMTRGLIAFSDLMLAWWPAMLLGLRVTIKVYWLALAFKRKGQLVQGNNA